MCIAMSVATTDTAVAQRAQAITVPITASSLDAYVHGATAVRAEMHRVDSLRSVAESTPQTMRVMLVSACTVNGINTTPGAMSTHAQMASDSARAVKMINSIDTVQMKKLAEAAQKGDMAAMQKLRTMSMNMATQQAREPAAMERAQRAQHQAEVQMAIREKCEKTTPPEAALTARIAAARKEVAQFGESNSSPALAAHLNSVKLRAAGGMGAAQYAALEERILMYIRSDKEPTAGYTAAELSALHARRAQLTKLAS
jgi:hypothetical protein